MDKDSKGQRKLEDSGRGLLLQWKDSAWGWNSSFVVCLARCPACCSITGLILL